MTAIQWSESAPIYRQLKERVIAMMLDGVLKPGDALPFWVGRGLAGQHHLYDLDVDPEERENRAGESGERELLDLLRTALGEIDAPAEQLARLGLT